MHVATFQVRGDNPSCDQVLNMSNHPHQLMIKLHLFEWLCDMLLFHACQQELF